MSVFYVLPPRSLLGEKLAREFARLVPGLPERSTARVDWERVIADVVTRTADGADVYVVHREDLPMDEDPRTALVDGYGAEPGDTVVIVSLAAESRPSLVSTHGISAAA